MIHDLGVFTCGVIVGCAATVIVAYAWWVSRALEGPES